MLYRFLDVEIDSERYVLARQNCPVRVEPRVLDLIIYMVRQRARMVTRQELLAEVWCHQAVSPSVLARAICLARKAINCSKSIRTVHARGYQWVTPVTMFGAPRPDRDREGCPRCQEPRTKSGAVVLSVASDAF
jgi:DNA-binding winged helix-turn-helix (wHTH) protein